MEDQPALKFSSLGEEFALLLLWKPSSLLLTPHWAWSKLCDVLLPPAESSPVISGESSCWRQLEGDFYDYYRSCKVICAMAALRCLAVSVTNTNSNVKMNLQAAKRTHSTQPSHVSREGKMQEAGNPWKMQETLLGAPGLVTVRMPQMWQNGKLNCKLKILRSFQCHEMYF